MLRNTSLSYNLFSKQFLTKNRLGSNGKVSGTHRGLGKTSAFLHSPKGGNSETYRAADVRVRTGVKRQSLDKTHRTKGKMAWLESGKSLLALVIFSGTLLALSGSTYSNPLSSRSTGRSRVTGSSQEWKAKRLFEYARRENGGLNWDGCLAKMAARRARMVAGQKGHLSHRDPRTGKNPAWDMISQCGSWRCAGENLVRGNVSPEELHETLMRSPSHRQTIRDRRYNRLGVGCYGQVCVELFAGVK
jgi:uncharacterized protein YkwD